VISLFIDTHTNVLNIAVLKDLNVLSSIKKEEKEHSTKTLMAIDECLQKAKTTLSDINRIYVVNGPGSFTGVRIGVTVAKTLAYTLKKEIVSVSSLMAYALSSGVKSIIVPIINARRGAVFGMIMDENNNILLNEQYILLEDLKEKAQSHKKDITYVSYDTFENIAVEKADMDFAKVVEYYQHFPCMNPHNVNPNYLKKTEAEENLQYD